MYISMTNFECRVAECLCVSLAEAGYDIVRVKIMGGKIRKTLQIMLDRLDGKAITLQDCEMAAPVISTLLDVEDIIENQYVLEVSSTGIERPLTRPKDFLRFKGQSVEIVSKEKQQDRKRFRGNIKDCAEEKVVISLLEDPQQLFTFKWNEIEKATLLYSSVFAH